MLPLKRDGIWCQVGEDSITLFLPDTNEELVLNRTAAAIWDLCDGEHTIAAMASCLGEIFPRETSDSLRADVEECIADLQRRNLLEAPAGPL